MRTLGLSLLLVITAACGSGDPSGGPDGGTPAECDQQPDLADRLEPWAVGTTWTYLLTEPVSGSTEVKDTVVEAYEDVGGIHTGTCAFRVRGDKLFGDTVSWQTYEGDTAVRYRADDYDPNGGLLNEQELDPYRLKVDETASNMQLGATYDETYDEIFTDATGTQTKSSSLRWTVISAAEEVTVPAGTFTAHHVQRVNLDNGNSKDFWFVAGIGKVKETGGSQHQDLMVYTP